MFRKSKWIINSVFSLLNLLGIIALIMRLFFTCNKFENKVVYEIGAIK